ncbi:MAG TPA: metallophosphoesterase [Gemmatimonadaceae bacterium]|nr:metallophosphoesterase [Gemmatimonadaceae bacterium]
MRLVHLADLHLGFRQYHRVTPNGLNQREADVASAFRRVVERVIELRPDIVVIAGDVFHTVRPMNPAIIHAFTQFVTLTRELPEAVIVVIAGNHDRPRSSETGCILRILSPLGIHVVDESSRRLDFPERSLSILAVPDQAGMAPELQPDPSARYNVLVLHGEVQGVLPEYLSRGDRAAMQVPFEALAAPRWSYIALGHYHVHREVAKNAYYSGALDYTSTNPWGEMLEEREAGLPGKGFIEFDLETAKHRFHQVTHARRFENLPAISARGRTAAELDALIRERVEACPGGIDEAIVRLVVRDVPRHVVRELDQKALREYQRRALHFHLDTRRPEIIRTAVGGAAGRRATLAEMVQGYLARRPLEHDLDRDALVQLGLTYLQEADATEQMAGTTPDV